MLFPTNAIAACFVVAIITWFLFWVYRLRSETADLIAVSGMLRRFDSCVEQLRAQQLWRDRQRLQGANVLIDPGEFFDTACASQVSGGPVMSAIGIHFRTIFVAGCDESSLDVADLTVQTGAEVASKSEQLRNEIILLFLVGVLGTLLALPGPYAAPRAFPPLTWGVLLTIAEGVLYLQLRRGRLDPLVTQLRRKTTSLWVPKLYPTVAQRAANWAIHTLHNAARVTDASGVIEEHATKFVASVEAARQAAEAFSAGMREFSHGMDVSDRALENAQSKLAVKVDRFADSLGRWGQFEDEIRRFYSAVEAHQRQIASEHQMFEAMLAGYYDLVRTSTNVLQTSATDLSSVAKSLPEAFHASAEKMAQTTAEFQGYLVATISTAGDAMKTAYLADSAEMQSRLDAVIAPVMNMEDRLRSLGTPFESASNKLVEIAENLWRLSDNFEQKVSRSMAELQATQARATAKSST